MCSTICPRSPKRPHVSDFFLTKHIWNAPTYAFHHNLFLVELVTMPQRSTSSKCARLSAPPPQKAPCFRIFLNQAYLEGPNLYLSPGPVFGRIGHNGSEIHVLNVCLTISPRKRAPCFRFFFNQAYLECPNLCLSPKLVSEQIGHNGSEIQVLQICSTIRPRKKAPCFRFFLNQAYLECPNMYLSAQPVFSRIGHNGSEIHVLKVCSTIRPPPPPKRPHVSDFFEPSIFGRPQPVPFTKTCFWWNWS